MPGVHVNVSVVIGKLWYHKCQLLCFTDMIKRLIGATYFSESVTNARTKEEATYMLFLDFLHECEGMKCENIVWLVVELRL